MNTPYINCHICPRECGIDRTKGALGFCNASDKIVAARAALHLWEEPCISGTNGSGTVFFSGCNLQCVYCQNSAISRRCAGEEVSPERLLEIFFELKEQGAHNINLVTATHFLPTILKVIRQAKDQHINIPFVYNSSGYENVEMLKSAQGLIDVYLPDFKYMSSSLAQSYSSAPDYPAVVKRALSEMVRQKPACVFDEKQMLTAGVLVRHLVLPGCEKDTKAILSYLYNTYQNKIYLSIMRQYTPPKDALLKFPKLCRPLKEKEYDRVIDYAIDLGISQAFIQEEDSVGEGFVPSFNGYGIQKERNENKW